MSKWDAIDFGGLFKTVYRYPTYYDIEYVENGVPEIRGELLAANGKISDDFRFISPDTANNFPKVRLEEGDIVMSVRGTLGKIGLVKQEHEGSVITANLLRLSPDRSKVNSGWLLQVLLSPKFLGQLENVCSQTTIKTIQVPKLYKILVDCPPLAEQRRISEILSTLDETIEQTEVLIAKHQQIKAGLMQDLFTRGTTPNGHLRPTREQAPNLYKESPLGWIPKTWEVGRLSDYLDPINGIKPGPFGSSITKDNYTASGFRVYGQEQVIAGSLEVGDYFISPSKFAEMRGFEVLANDVLLSLVGTVGCVLVVEPPFEPGIINPRLIRLRPGRDIALAHFLKYLLLTAGIRRQLDSLAGGGTMSVINGKVIRRLVAPLLAIHEQERIVERLDALDQSVISWSDDLSKLRQQKQGLMQDLLTGRMRVPVGVAGRLDRTDQSDQSDPSDVFARSYRSDPTAQSDKNRRSIKP